MRIIISIIILCCIITITSCRKNPPDTKTHKGKFRIFKSCGVPLANKPIRLLLSADGYKYKQIAEVWTDSLGYAEIEHYYTNQGVITMDVYLSTVSGTRSRIGDYGFNWYQYKEYEMEVVVFANGSQIPIQLNNYSSYSPNDTIHYKILGYGGDSSATKWRYKVGPFQSPFIDTLTFPNYGLPAVLNSSNFIEFLEMPVQFNTVIYGKSIEECLDYQNTGKYFHFHQPGCGIVDTILFDK
jgi:hypothetical protein